MTTLDTHGNSPTVSEGSVRLIQEKYAEIWVDGKWSPICGPGFWDNNIGATLFCQKLDQRQWTDTCYPFITLMLHRSHLINFKWVSEIGLTILTIHHIRH